MAEGGENIEMENPNILLALEKYNREFRETSFMNPAYEDNTAYNTGANLSSDTSFTPPRTTVADTSLTSQQINFAENEDKLKNAFEGTGWKCTNTGLTKLSAKVFTEGNKLFYKPSEWEINKPKR